ncbi:MAG: RNA 3'-terminal phosphate cyclase [Puniceicoccales bacterium]|jgi:RNA 3'-terminal phosphate cyclase (ATP)|nr:RNA 3'-terminal phosphate cyclase [Puniceicoccales bacterium]
MSLIHIDGSEGEGGGQILRTSLALSIITGKPIRIDNIRAGRSKPGLLRQHLASVKAAVEISRAKAEGVALGSTALTFHPGNVTAGEYRFSIGSAGSALLVFQTILLPLLHADAPSTVTIEGGTHNPFAPPFPFIEKTFLPLLHQIGYQVEVKLERPGFYPAGGGIITATITPGGKRRVLKIGPRTEILDREAIGVVANLSRKIAERELERLGSAMSLVPDEMCIHEINDTPGPGNALFVKLRSSQLTETFSSFGEQGRHAEKVADGLHDEVRRYLKSNGAVGEHLADQLLLPLALAKGGVFTTLPPSRHTQTNIAVIGRFLDARINVRKIDRLDYEIEVKP